MLKTQHSENYDHGIWSHHFMANWWGNKENSERLYLGGSKITADGDHSHEIKRHLLLGRKAMTNLDSILKSRDSVQLSSIAQSCLTLCNPMNCSTPGLPVHHQLPESTQTHVHRVGDAIQPSHTLSCPFPPTLNLSQHQGLFQWVSSLYQVAKILESQLQHQSFQWTSRTNLL